MRITIGEIVNIVMPYVEDLQLRIMNHMPFIKACVKDHTLLTKYWIYVVQSDDFEYSYCESRDDIFDRYFPSGNCDKPIISETDLIKKIFDLNRNDISYKYETVMNSLDVEGFLTHFLTRLYENRIIRFNPKKLSLKLDEIGILNKKFVKNIQKVYDSYRLKNPSIQEIIKVIYKKHKRISFQGLRDIELELYLSIMEKLGIKLYLSEDKEVTSLKFILTEEH